MVVSDVLQAGTATITIVTRCTSTPVATKLQEAASGARPAPPGRPLGLDGSGESRYVRSWSLHAAQTTPRHLSQTRVWTLGLVEMARPPDDGVS